MSGFDRDRFRSAPRTGVAGYRPPTIAQRVVARQAQFTPVKIVSSALNLRQHLSRMLATAGHSWHVGEHQGLTDQIADFYRADLARQIGSQISSKMPQIQLPQSVKPYVHHLRKFRLEAPLAAVIFFSLLIPVFNASAQAAGYDLTKAGSILTNTPSDLQRKLSYNSSQQSFMFNPNPADEMPSKTADSTSIGGLTYGANLPADINSQTSLAFTDAQTQNTLKLTPEFMLNQGKQEQGHIVYPLLADNAQLVYTFKGNGVKEDIVLYNAPGDSASFNYKLQLPNGLVARAQKDGSIGIFGGDPTLFGNVSASDSKDQDLLQKARQNAPKNQLYYIIPAPVITGDSQAKAHFTLDGDTLIVTATDLAKAHYPLSIDPSFIMNTANCTTSWGMGTSEDNISCSSGVISRSNLTGGDIGGWNSTTGLTNAISGSSAVTYNGYLYLLGGSDTVTFNYTGAQVDWTVPAGITSVTIDAFGAQGGNGAAGTGGLGGEAKATISVTPGDTLHINVGGNGSTNLGWGNGDGGGAKNGGGTYGGGASDVRQGGTASSNRVVVAGGGGGAGQGGGSAGSGGAGGAGATTGDGANGTAGSGNANFGSGGTASGSGGAGGAATGGNGPQAGNPGLSAAAGGTGGASNVSANFAGGPGGGGYAGGGSATSANLGTNMSGGGGGSDFIPGTCTTANGTTAVCAGNVRSGDGKVTISMNGGLVQYAAINSNGTLGSWTNVSGFSNNRNSAAAVAYNGYLYIMGGIDDASTNYNDVQYAAINSNGTLGSWTSTSSFLVARNGLEAVAMNGYMYIMGGYDGSTYHTDVQYAPIKGDGTIGAWHYTHASGDDNTTFVSGFTTGRTQFGAAGYNGYLYIFGGQTGTGTYTNSTAYAYVNSNGTVSAWTTGTNMATAAGAFTSSLSNGYIYAWGGTTGSLLNSTQYAQVYANGALGAWGTSVNTLSTARSGASGAIYSNVLYTVGGTGASGTLSDSWYAAVDTPGVLLSGTWPSGTSLVGSGTSDFGRAAAITNGYIYSVGGIKSSGGILAEAQFAAINNDGSLGSWTTTTSMTTARIFASMVAYNGYLYVIGGCSTDIFGQACTASLATTEYAKPNGDGTIPASGSGTWAAGTSLTTGTRNLFGAAAYNGYLYVTGNSNAGSTSTGTTDYIQLSSTGTMTGSWATTGSSFGAVTTTMAAYNGYLYAADTRKAASGGSGTVKSAQINSNGTVNSWTTTGVAALPTTPTDVYGKLVVIKGYLYFEDAGGTVYYTVLNSSGTISAWTSTTAAANPTAPAVAASSNAIYTINVDGTTQYQSVNHGGSGSPGTWASETNTFTTGREGLASVAFNGYLYALGGYDGSTYYADVQYAAIKGDGTLGSWTSAGSNFTTARYNFGAVAYGGYLYIAGGQGSSSVLSDVQYAKFGSTGTLASNAGCGSTWCTGTSLPAAMAEFSLVASGGYLYEVGGTVPSSQTFSYTGASQSWTVPTGVTSVTIEVWGAQGGSMLASGDGGLGGYAEATITTTPGQNLDVEVGGKGVDSTNNTTPGAGGYNGGGAGTAGSFYAGGGGGGASDVRQGGSALANRVVIAGGGGGGLVNVGDNGGTGGGTNGGNGLTATSGLGGTQSGGGAGGNPGGLGNFGNPGVLGVGGAGATATGGSNGASGGGGGYYGGGGGATASFVGAGGGGSGFVPATDPNAGMNNGVQTGNGKVVISYVASGVIYNNSINSTPIGSNGSVSGSWSDANNGGSSFSTGRAGLGAVAYGGYLYVVGGYDGTNYRNDVQYASLSGGGLLGSWNTAASMGFGRSAAAVTAANGFLYVTGGRIGGTNFNDTQYAPILSTGQLGQWGDSRSPGWTARSNATGVAYGGYMFELGGYDGTATRHSDTQYTQLAAIGRSAQYSVELVTDQNTKPVNVLLNDSPENAGSNISLAFATAVSGTPTYGTLTLQAANMNTVTKYPLTISGDGIKYYYLYLTIDDSQAATFGETGGTQISYLKVNYHPANSMRLRGGMTFNSGSLQSLDAP